MLSKEERIRRRASNRAYAADLGVDLAALARLGADFRQRFQELHKSRLVIHSDNRVVTLPDQQESAPKRAAGWAGTWDPGYEYYTSHASQFAIWNAGSYYNPASSRTGSNIRFRQRETDNFDNAWLNWRNGYMVFYTMPTTAHIMVTVTLTYMFSHHFIDTDNEPGDSECQVMVGQWVGAEIFSDWSDGLPQEYVPSSAHLAYDYTAHMRKCGGTTYLSRPIPRKAP